MLLAFTSLEDIRVDDMSSKIYTSWMKIVVDGGCV